MEVNHRKGALDGVGAVYKRTADRMIKRRKDVGSFNDLEMYLRNFVDVSIKRGYAGTSGFEQRIS